MPYSFYDELIHSHSLTGGIIHLSIGDGAAALAAIEAGVKCLGVCLSEKHVEMLYEKLAEEVFLRMQDQHSSLFQKALKAAVAEEGEKKGKETEEKKEEKQPKKRKKKGV